MRRYYPAALVAILPVFAGCGGGSTTPVAATTPLKFDLAWAARSRAIAAPASARSAVVYLQQGNPTNGGSVQFPTIDRADSPAAYTQSYVSPTAVRPGPNLLTIVFYSDKGGAGDVVGTASKAINLASDGTGIGEILTVGKVQTVAIVGASALTVGQSTTLHVAATDGNGAAVAVSAGSGTYSVLSGGDFVTLTPDGSLTARAVGVAQLQVSLDGKTSAPFPFTSRAPGSATALITAGQSVRIGESKTLEASFTDASGTPITVDPSQITFEVVSGGDTATLAANGAVTGEKLGTLQVRVKIPGLESAATAVAVVAGSALTVRVPELQSVGIAETKTLLVEVKDSNGNPVPVGAGVAQFALTRGSEALTLTGGGSATGTAAGYAIVTASVGGTTSVPQAVLVGPVVTTASGLKYIEKGIGAGATATVGQSVQVNYTGSLLNGTIFDSSLNPGRTPLAFTVGGEGLIPGFDEGVRGMRVGGKRLIVVPPALGYGVKGNATIPPNSTLLFDLELVSVE